MTEMMDLKFHITKGHLGKPCMQYLPTSALSDTGDRQGNIDNLTLSKKTLALSTHTAGLT